MATTRTVFGILKTEAAAVQAAKLLKTAGFSPDDISALFSDKSDKKDFAPDQNTKAPKGAAAGAGIGGIVGGIGALTIPGVGPLIAASSFVVALSGAAAGGIVGGLAGTLIGLGYKDKSKGGNILLSVHVKTSDEIDQAKEIFASAGAEDISSTSEDSASGLSEVAAR